MFSIAIAYSTQNFEMIHMFVLCTIPMGYYMSELSALTLSVYGIPNITHISVQYFEPLCEK